MSPKMAKRIILNNSSTLRSLNTDASANGRLAEKRTNVNNAKGVKRVAMRDDTLSTRKRLCNKINRANTGTTANPQGAIC